uniref:Uncharacterized protein n=1 Tax=Thermosporothrix sp. COM3 TaxID=2490863 RepID=A0A455SJU7_9CHLR|nr:hypothetical protein KTC_11660 [Thermosporothrix sp. COM3]
MFCFTVGEYRVSVSNTFPSLFWEYHKKARIVEHIGDVTAENTFVILVAKGNAWPFLILILHVSVGEESGFNPGVFLLPETQTLFIGAGEILLIYHLEREQKIWEERIMGGFWGWHYVEPFVLLSAEIELSIWNKEGERLWETFVEPPWSYELEGDVIKVFYSNETRYYRLQDGTEVEQGNERGKKQG